MYDAMVYSDSTPDQTAQDLSPTDRGMWWACLAIWDGRRFRTWCQAFALGGTRTTWDTSPSRIHIYKRRNQPTPWAESTATAPSSGAASSSPPPPPPPPPTASAPTDRGMWWAPQHQQKHRRLHEVCLTKKEIYVIIDICIRCIYMCIYMCICIHIYVYVC